MTVPLSSITSEILQPAFDLFEDQIFAEKNVPFILIIL